MNSSSEERNHIILKMIVFHERQTFSQLSSIIKNKIFHKRMSQVNFQFQGPDCVGSRYVQSKCGIYANGPSHNISYYCDKVQDERKHFVRRKKYKKKGIISNSYSKDKVNVISPFFSFLHHPNNMLL